MFQAVGWKLVIHLTYFDLAIRAVLSAFTFKVCLKSHVLFLISQSHVTLLTYACYSQ